MQDFIKLVEICLNFINGNNFTALFYIILLVISVWLFKEFRKNKIETNNSNIQRMDTALERYGKALSSINKFKEHSIDFQLLMDDFVLLYPYTTKKIIEYVNTMSIDNDNLGEIDSEIKKEVKRLKKLQYDNVSSNYPDEFIDSLSYYYKKDFDIFISPLFNTVIAITCIMFFLLYLCIWSTKVPTINKVMVTLIFIVAPVYVLTLITTVEVISEKNFKTSILNIIFVVVLFALMVIITLPWKWISSVIFISYTFIYMKYFFKRIIKKDKGQKVSSN